ncbi:Uncharacterised protein [Escherichia coli]|uniref:Uncharacterized protein n=1 Tax=Escherichia coli TaxID=562 RepID=A0A2X1NAL9_ECOLX|nr:Uncharacterised protein [Escherichia coli]
MKSVTEIQVKEEPLFDQRLLHKNEQNEIFLSFCNSSNSSEYIGSCLITRTSLLQ